MVGSLLFFAAIVGVVWLFECSTNGRLGAMRAHLAIFIVTVMVLLLVWSEKDTGLIVLALLAQLAWVLYVIASVQVDCMRREKKLLGMRFYDD